MKLFDTRNWVRKNQFEFFKNYQDPFFNLTGNLEVGNLYEFCKKNNLSFSLACIFVALKSMNEIDEFKLRFQNEKVYLFDKIHIGSTVLNEDKTFSFCYFPYLNSIFEFDKQGKEVIENHRKGVAFEPRETDLDIIHCSTLPWVEFTSIKHARKGDEAKLGIPKIVFGKKFQDGNKLKIPFSIEAHHALVDGYHVGQLFIRMQQYINELNCN